MNSEIQNALHILESQPDSAVALTQLAAAIEGGSDGASDPSTGGALVEARRVHRERGDCELVARLIDLQLGWEKDPAARAELHVEKGRLLGDELLLEEEAEACFQRALLEKPGHEGATEALADIAIVRDAWQKIAKKYVAEAEGATDRQLGSSLHLSAAEVYWKHQPGAPEIERHLRRALEIEPRNRKASQHLERLLRGAERWPDLATLLEQRVAAAAARDEKVALLNRLAEVERDRLGRPDAAIDAVKKALAIEPANPRAMALLVERHTSDENWQGLLKVYEAALKSRPRGEAELAILVQIGMVWWKKLGNLDSAEPFFAKVRKVDPTQPAMLAFYRAWHGERNEPAKLLQVLGQAQKIDSDPKRRLALAVEMAELAEASAGNVEKAIDIWKGVLKQSAGSADAVAALKRLYTRAEKWNALLELLKEQIDALPKDTPEAIAERVKRLLEVVAIYRDKLNLDVMVINTYNTILALSPPREQMLGALSALAAKYEQLGRWNDLIGVLQRKADAAPSDPEGVAEKAKLLRRIAQLWIDRFGNHNQAVKPLEELAALLPDDREAVAQLRDIYVRRRAWRALLDLERRDVDRLKGAERRAKLVEMAKLAAERLGDVHEAIALWNRVLEDDPEDRDALAALAALYEREKRWPALVEVLRRSRARLTDAKALVPLLEKIGALWSDRLAAPQRAVEAWQEILRFQPGYPKALRVLRELFAQAGDFARLESLYAEQGQWEELCEVLVNLAERGTAVPADAAHAAGGEEATALRVRLHGRVADIALQQLRQPERALKAYERILAVAAAGSSEHLGAANAMVPLYRATEKWARLLATYEILLEHAKSDDERLGLHREIRSLCEERLGSAQLAFTWCARAYELRPSDAALGAELLRLATAADAWEELAVIYAAQVERVEEGDEKIARYRQLGDLILRRLRRPDEARPYYSEVVKRAPDDGEAGAALEQIYSQGGAFPELLALYRDRIDRRGAALDPAARIELLFKISWIEEEKSGDLDAAAATYRRILGEEPSSTRALRALERIYRAKGDGEALAEVLGKQLALVGDDAEAEVALCVQLGELNDLELSRPDLALAYYQRAFARQPSHRQTIAALERYLSPGSPGRVDVARLLAPVYEQADDPARLAQALAILLDAAGDPDEELGLLRRLVAIAGRRLGEAESAYNYAARIFRIVPADEANRRELADLGDLLDRHEDHAKLLAAAEQSAAAGSQPELARDLAWELGVLLDDRLERGAEAEKAWRRVIERDPRHDNAFAALERHYRDAEQFPALRALLAQRKDLAESPEARRDLLFQIADLDEGVLGDEEAAARTYGEALEADPSSQRAFRALERIHTGRARWGELDQLYSRAVPWTDEAVERAHLKLKRADLHAARLDDAAGACDLYEEALAEDARNDGARKGLERLMAHAEGARGELRHRAAKILEPLFAADEAWPKLVQVLEVQRERAPGREAVELLARIARLVEDKLGSRQQAFTAWREALRLDPTDETVRAEVERLANVLERWSDLAEAWEDAEKRCDTNDLLLRAELTRKAAQLYDEQILDPEKARAAWRRLLDLDPTRLETARPAAEALARLYEAEEAWPELIDVLRRQCEWAEEGGARKELQRRIGLIQEDLLDDTAAAVATHREILDGDPEDREALDALERLYAARGEWRELVEVLRRRVDLSHDAAVRRDLLWRIADLTEHKLFDGRPESDVITAWAAILDEQPEDVPALDSLARLYEAAGRPADLLEVLERRLALAASVEERVALLGRIAALLEHQLSRPSEALDRFREVLVDEPDNAAARAGLERMLTDEDLRLRAAEVLEPIYEGRGDVEQLIQLSELWAEHSEDARERIARLGKAARLHEQLGRTPEAFGALSRAARAAVGEPDLPALLDGLDRLAGKTGMRAEQVALYREIGADVLDAAVQERIYLSVAALSRALGDRDAARDYYRRVLDATPDHGKALDALESLYSEGKEHEPLLEIYNRRAELAAAEGSTDDEQRRYYLALAAQLCAGELDRPSEAIGCYEQILEMFPADADAAKALERLYEKGGRFADLADLLERRMGFADDLDEAVGLRYRLGQIYETELRDADRAVENYRAAMGGDADHAGAIAALERFLDDADHRVDAAEVLEPVYAGRHDWRSLIRIYEIRLEAAEDPQKRLALTRRIARLYEEQLEDLEAAFRWFGRVFRENPSDRAIRDQLGRLAHILDRHAELARVYEEYLAETYEETPASLEVARTLAAIYDARLNDVDKAKACYKRLLAHDPGDAPAFQALEASLARAERWSDLLGVYRDALDGALDGARRKVLLFKICELEQHKLGDAAAAIESYRAILDVDPDDARAIAALDQLCVEGKRWHDLAELCLGRLDKADRATWIALKLRLGSLYEKELSDLPSAIDAFEEVLGKDAANREAVAALERLILDHDQRFRIAQILEPIYKRADQWAQLVVIYEAELEFIDDKAERVATLREIARLHERRGGDLQHAFRALARAWTEEAPEGEAREAPLYMALAEMALGLEAWGDLVTVLEAAIDGSYDYDLVARVEARVAEIRERRLGDLAAAVESWRKVTGVHEDDVGAWKAIERLLGQLGRHAELVAVLEKRGELSNDLLEQKALAYRAADLYEHTLGQRDRAISTWRNVLNLDENDRPALDALVRLYQASGNFRELALTYARQIDLALSEQEKRPLRFSMARVYESELSDAFEAIAVYKAVLDAQSTDGEALVALERLYEAEGMWPDLLETVDRRAKLAATTDRGGDAHNTLRFRAAKVLEDKQGEAEAAIDRYRQILDDAPGHEPSRAALDALVRREETREAAAAVLDPLYYSRGEFAALIEVRELKLSGESDPAARRTLLAGVAELYELGLSDAAGAFKAWGRLIVEEPGDEEAYQQIERLAEERGAWKELADLYEERIEALFDPEAQRMLALKLADVYERRLSDVAQAIAHQRRALRLGGEEAGPLAALDRLLSRAGDFAALAEVLEQEAQAANDPAAQAGFLHRLGDLKRVELHDAEGAIAAYRDALDREPRHAPTRDALEGMLGSDKHALAVLDILEPLAESDGDVERQAMFAGARLRFTDGKAERSGLLQRIAELCEKHLGDLPKALDALGRALAETPDDALLAEEVERVGTAAGRPGEAAAAFERVLRRSGVEQPAFAGLPETGVGQDVAKELGLRAARIYDRLGDDRHAEERYLGVLAVDAESADALGALERIYRRLGSSRRLAETLDRRAALENDVLEKKRLIAESARLWEGALAGEDANGEQAVAAWRRVLDVDEGDHDALDALAALHERAGRWADLVAVLEQKARVTDSTSDQVALKELVASLYAEKLGALDRAVDAYRDLLDIQPDSLRALRALEELQAKRGDWLAVQEVLVRHLGVLPAGPEQIPILRRLAQLAVEKQKSPEDAIAYFQQVVELGPDDLAARGDLEAALEKAEKWWDLVDALKQHAERCGAAGDHAGEVALLVRTADLLEEKLESSSAASEILEAILEREPRNVKALMSLARQYESAGELDKCKDTLERAAALVYQKGASAAAEPRPSDSLRSPQGGADAAELFFRLGRLEEERAGEAPAETYYQKAFDADPDHAGATEALEKAARRRQDWDRVAALLVMRAESAPETARKALFLETAKIHAEKLGAPAAAVPFFERAADLAPDDPAVLEPLADAYFGAERYVDALPLYRKLIDALGKGRRTKDLGRLHFRLGAISEAGGNERRAVEHYQQAQQIDPAHAPTLAALGRLHVAAAEWEKARRIYRSMLLQNLDPSVGISKAEIYLALGDIHEKVNEEPKALGMYERGLEVDPKNEKLKAALARVKGLK